MHETSESNGSEPGVRAERLCCAQYAKRNFWLSDDLDFLRHIEGARSFHENNRRPSGAIPKRIHFIWLGSALKPTHWEMVNTWVSMHSDTWTVNVWTDDNVSFLRPHVLEAFNGASDFGAKSDILRYEILYRMGGVYADVDYECIHSLDDVCERASFFAGLSNTTALEVNNGVIGSCPGHPILASLLNNIMRAHKEEEVKNASSAEHPCGDINPAILAFLSPSEVAAMQRASKKTDPMHTIATSGPGALTRSMYEYLVDAAFGSADSSIGNIRDSTERGKPDSRVQGDICEANAMRTSAKVRVGKEIDCSSSAVIIPTNMRSGDGDGGDDGGDDGELETTETKKVLDDMPPLILPYDVFHAVPNSIHVNMQDPAQRAELIATHCTSRSLAVHWWQRSWQ